jgi:hypothetical protein
MEVLIVTLSGAVASLLWGVISAILVRRRKPDPAVQSWAGGEDGDLQIIVAGSVSDEEAAHVTYDVADPPPGVKLVKVVEPEVEEVRTTAIEKEAVVRISDEDKADLVSGVAAILKRGERRAFFIGFLQSAFFFALGVGVTLLAK